MPVSGLPKGALTPQGVGHTGSVGGETEGADSGSSMGGSTGAFSLGAGTGDAG